jgi:hypothetical protein
MLLLLLLLLLLPSSLVDGRALGNQKWMEWMIPMGSREISGGGDNSNGRHG